MATHIKLRPLVVYDSASSQSSVNDICASDVSASVRAHCALPSTGRGKLVPAPPDTGTAADDDSGVSKLRSKLRRLLGAHCSNKQVPQAPKGASLSQPPALRCSSTADLNERRPSSGSGNRSTNSLPVSPNIAIASGARGRFLSTGIVVPNSASSTPPATPGSNASSPSVHGSRNGVPTTPAASSAVSNPRCPSANNSTRGLSLRRAVSFSPIATTFPPLGSPNVPSPPPGQAPGATNGVARTSISSSNSFAAPGRLSNMIVVPEDETLPEDYFLPMSAGSIAGHPRSAHMNELILRNDRISSSDHDSSPLPPAASFNAASHHQYDSGVYGTGGAAAAAAALSPSRQLACVFVEVGVTATAHKRSSTSSSSSTNVVTTGNGYMEGPALGSQSLSSSLPIGTTSAAAALTSWSSDTVPVYGPFHHTAATAPLFDSSTAPPPPIPSPQPQQMVRSQPLKPTHVSGSGSGRPLSSSSTAGGTATPAGPSPRGSVAFHHQTAAPPSAPAGASHVNGGSGMQLNSHTSMTPPLTRGMSAFSLSVNTASAAAPRGAGSPSSPWSTAAGGSPGVLAPTSATAAAAAAMMPEAPSTPAQQPCVTVDSRTGTPTKPPPIRRAHSTIDNSSRSQVEAPNGPPGVVLALGASLPSEMKRKEWRVEDFTMLKRLYKGNYSAVHKALCRMSMKLVVIKTYDTTRMTELARNHVKREAALHAPLEHDNILNLYAVFTQGPYVMLVEEVAEGGDLYHVLKSIPGHRLQEDRAVAGVLVPLLRALANLHEQGICHRDIKLENILFADRQHTRMLLADFGIALSLRQERAVTRAGTTEYMSPEQLRCPFKRHPSDNKDRTDLHYGLGVDVWASGVLAYELLHGYPPFLGTHREDTERLIMTQEVQVSPQLSHGARDFVLQCLNKDPEDRPTVMQLLQHSWIRQHMRVLR